MSAQLATPRLACGVVGAGNRSRHSFRRRDLMSEAVRKSTGRGFGASEIANIRPGIGHFNAASLAIPRKMGFVVTGRSRAMCLARGKEIDHIDAELSREAFEDART